MIATARNECAFSNSLMTSTRCWYVGVLIEKPRQRKEIWRYKHEHKTKTEAIKCADAFLNNRKPER